LTAALQVGLKAAPSGVLSNGTSLTFGTTIAGQSSYLTFAATAGQSASLALTGLSLAPNSVTSVTVTVSKPDGTSLTLYQPGVNQDVNLQKNGVYANEVIYKIVSGIPKPVNDEAVLVSQASTNAPRKAIPFPNPRISMKVGGCTSSAKVRKPMARNAE